jgi:endonuclease-3
MTKKERYEGIIGWFEANVPVAETELHYSNPYELLVATILSAQCTDKRVNITTPALFDRFPTPALMARADAEEIFPYIKSISYPNNKAKNLSAMARMLTDKYGGEVPADRDEMMKLPGVGRKTANVVSAVIFGKPFMAVDTHVFRVAGRTGLATGAKTPLAVEQQLTENIPARLIPLAHHWLILHGRYVCTARAPHCTECGIAEWCKKRQSDLKKETLPAKK